MFAITWLRRSLSLMVPPSRAAIVIPTTRNMRLRVEQQASPILAASFRHCSHQDVGNMTTAKHLCAPSAMLFRLSLRRRHTDQPPSCCHECRFGILAATTPSCSRRKRKSVDSRSDAALTPNGDVLVDDVSSWEVHEIRRIRSRSGHRSVTCRVRSGTR
ncbi:hypothetical protein BD413DRAFT_76295 [Trametes elegans]|nr:hypothetical protein BD413DRAFT_76295 [Trametes elegans]